MIRQAVRTYFAENYPNWYIDSALRYAPILDALGDGNGANVLEIGSGVNGITPYLARSVVGVDIRFQGVQNSLLQRILASACSLPFADEAFDSVVCMDLLEHVPPCQRQEAVTEAMRVAKGTLFLSVPCGAEAERYDRRLNDIHIRKRKTAHPSIKEHLLYGLPRAHEVQQYISRATLSLARPTKIRQRKNMNLWLWFVLRRFALNRCKLLAQAEYRWALPFFPVLKLMNSGRCYRLLFTISFAE